MLISLSILDYEADLAANINNILESTAMKEILSLTQTGKIHRVHIDVMRPPMIPNRTAFKVELVNSLYQSLCNKVPLAIHLMVDNPYPLIEKINTFIPNEKRNNTEIFIQRESFSSETDTKNALNYVKECNYISGICLNLPTPCKILTADIIELADPVLLMTVPMGAGGQKYSEEGTKRITQFHHLFPKKTIVVDGGINSKTIVEVKKAGAKIAIVGAFITRNKDPIGAVLELEKSVKYSKNQKIT
jgi:pentose-5-phosphate-3-epimerase